MDVNNGHESPNCWLESLINRSDHSLSGSPTPLHLATTSESHAIQSLIQNGADIESMDEDGSTPLHRATEAGNVKIVQLLLDAGSCLSRLDYHGRSPLWYACDSGNWETINLLSDFLPMNLTERTKLSLLMPLLISGASIMGTRLFEVLFNDEANLHKKDQTSGLCPAHLLLAGPQSHFLWMLGQDLQILRPLELEWPEDAIRDVCETTAFLGRLKVLRLLLSNEEMQAVLGIHAPGKHSFLCETARRGSIENAASLLKHGADVDYVCDIHGTPLMAALSGGKTDMVKYLIRQGAQISLRPEVIFKDGQHAGTLRFPNVMDWILVTRHIEQPRLLNLALNQSEDKISSWSGVASVAIHVKWEWQKGRRESMLEYAARRQAILLGLRGTIITPIP